MLKLQRVENALVFLTLLFLPTQLGKHFWPQFSFIYSLKIDYLSPTLYFWDLLVILLMVVWFIRKPKINKSALNLFLFFIFTQALSLIGASSVGAGLVRLEQYVISGLFGIYIASQDFKSLSKRILLPLCLGISGESLLAIMQFIKGGTIGLWVLGERSFNVSTPGIAKFDFYGMQFLRPYGTFPHPNVLAAFLLLTIVILVRLFVVARREPSTDAAIYQAGKIASPLHGLAMTILKVSGFLVGLAIFLTVSRLVILAGIGSLLLVIKRKWLIWAALVFLIVSPILFTRFSSLINFDNLALVRREELFSSGWQVFISKPIFGIGLNSFIPAMAGNLLTGPSRFLQPVHNIFLLTLSETGITGLIGLIGLIGIPILSSLRRSKILEGQGSINIIPWLIIIFLGLFDHYFLTLPQGYRLLFLVWGLSFAKSIVK